MAACLQYVRQFDDYIETLEFDHLQRLLVRCQSLMDGESFDEHSIDSGLIMTRAFIRHLQLLLPNHFEEIIVSVKEMIVGFQEEADFQHEDQFDINLYEHVRHKTISVQPFFGILAAGSFINVKEETSNDLRSLENEVITMIGLRNDLLGLQKDLQEKKFMSYPVVYARTHYNNDLDAAINAGTLEHNQANQEAHNSYQKLIECNNEAVRMYADQIFSFSALHLKVWMKSSRYKSKAAHTSQQACADEHTRSPVVFNSQRLVVI